MFGIFGSREEMTFVCPRCGSEEYSIWKLPNLLFLHWILNPGLMVNELLLGQRLPSRLYLCKSCPQFTLDNQYVYCPACGEFHEGMIWAKNNAFGHWLGIVCPDCGCRIPSLLNLTSWFVLSKLSPISWLLWWSFGERYQAFEQGRAYRARTELMRSRWEREQA